LYIAARGSFTAIVDMIIKTARLDYPAPVRSPHPAPLHADTTTTNTITITTHPPTQHRATCGYHQPLTASFQHDTTQFASLSLFIYICSNLVLYGCETWSLTLREEKKLRVFENMMLRRIFGPRRDEVTGE